MNEITYERAQDLLEAELGEELVALDPAGGQCFGFNGVATSVWRLLEQPMSRLDLEQALLSQYEVEPDQCNAELQVLLDDLIAKGLVRATPAGSVRNDLMN